MTPRNSRQKALSLVDILFVRTGTARREQIHQSKVFAYCSDILASPCELDPTDLTQRLAEARG